MWEEGEEGTTERRESRVKGWAGRVCRRERMTRKER